MHATVAPGVAVVDTQIAAGKAGVIAGERVALAVDAGIDDTEGAAVLAAAQAFGSDEVALVYTHGHIDHALGGTAFAGRRIYAHAEVGWYMRTQLEAWAARTGETTASLDARLGWPTATITGEATLDLGGRRVCFVAAPGHAPGAICIFDPEARVLFGGDTVVTAIPPAFSDGDSGVLEDTLRRLAGLDARLLVPGHGAVVEGADEVRAAILWSADYLAACREHVARHGHLDVDEIVAGAAYETFIGDHLVRERFRMEWRHEQTIRRICAEFGRAQG